MRSLKEVLADLTGPDQQPWDDTDEHERWRVYAAAADVPACRDLLQEAATVEPEPAVASALVVLMLERVPAADRAQWVALAPDATREFVRTRSRELSILESLRLGEATSRLDRDLINEWSDWLQLRAATSADSEIALHLLHEFGRTKRIRRTAAETQRRG